MSLTSIELFAGAGGLAMGASLAGYRSLAVVEWDKWACDTIRQNQQRGHPLVQNWPLFEGDVRDWIANFDTAGLENKLDLISAGPPCQPFSMGGKHRAYLDHRDMFPVTVEVIRRVKPRAFIVENVKGLTRASFEDYFQYIQGQLEFPELVRKGDESWADHFRRLQVFKTSRRWSGSGLSYRLIVTLVNAANYGVPQKRERVFIVGYRSDIDARWHFPTPTHSFNALLNDQWVTSEYWDRHGIASSRRPAPPTEHRRTLDTLRGLGLAPMHAPWRTVRDALFGLPEPEVASSNIRNHRLQPGARSYAGHTGSPIDLPAKTLKAGDHGVPGGENMLVRPNGELRYFTVRESARLQTFPDGYELHGSWSEAMRQLGNAVPVRLGQTVAASVASHLLMADHRHNVARSNAPVEWSV